MRISPAATSVLKICAISALLLFVFGAGLTWRFGSLQVAIGVLSGQPIVVSPTPIDVGHAADGSLITFDIEMRNETQAPLVVLGVDDCCYCRLADGVPIEIMPQTSKTCRIAYTVHGEAGQVIRSIIPLITTCPTYRPMMLVTGCVTKKQTSEGLAGATRHDERPQ